MSVLLALKTKVGLWLRRTSLATVLAPPRSAKSGKGMGSVTGGAGGGGQQKSGTVKTTRNLLLLRAILLTAMGCFTPGIGWWYKDWYPLTESYFIWVWKEKRNEKKEDSWVEAISIALTEKFQMAFCVSDCTTRRNRN